MPTLLQRTILTRNVGQTALVFGVGALVGLYMQDLKSLHAAVMICATLVNIQTQTHTDSIITSLYE